MNQDALRIEYLQRLNKVLSFIQDNLDQDLSSELIASVACFSPFHFHRIFKSIIGETIFEFITRLRLEKAANGLVLHHNLSITEIALGCGFTDVSSFTRSFTRKFGMNPRKYRQSLRIKKSTESKEIPSGNCYTITIATLQRASEQNRSGEECSMQVEVKLLPSYHVAFIRHIAGYMKGVNNQEIGKAFERLCAWAQTNNFFSPDTLVIGIPWDNPDVTPNDKCRYDACLTVSDSVLTGSGEVGIQDIPGGNYAVLHIEAREFQDIGNLVDRLYREWLPVSGFEPDDRPCLEIYYDNPNKSEIKVIMDFCLPLRTK